MYLMQISQEQKNYICSFIVLLMSHGISSLCTFVYIGLSLEEYLQTAPCYFPQTGNTYSDHFLWKSFSDSSN